MSGCQDCDDSSNLDADGRCLDCDPPEDEAGRKATVWKCWIGLHAWVLQDLDQLLCSRCGLVTDVPQDTDGMPL